MNLILNFVFLILSIFNFINGDLQTRQNDNILEQKTELSLEEGLSRHKRQGYGMWNGGNWQGPGGMGYRNRPYNQGPQGPPPDDSIKGSIGTNDEKSKKTNQTNASFNGDSNNSGSASNEYWNGNAPNGYNEFPEQSYSGRNGFSGNVPYNNNGRPDNNVEMEIKGSIGTAVKPTQNSINGNNNVEGYGLPSNKYRYNGFNRSNGYGRQQWGRRPMLPRGMKLYL